MDERQYFDNQARERLELLGIASGPKQPLEEKDAEIARLRDQLAIVRGTVIGALTGGHLERDGASYSRAVFLNIADILDIKLPGIVKGEQQG